MVQQDVIDYIKLGKERGYSVNLLKSKLLENGFTMQEVNEAVDIVEKQEPVKEKPAIPTGNDYFKKDDKPIVQKLETKPSAPLGGNKGLKIAAYAGFVLLGLLALLIVFSFINGAFTNFGVSSISSDFVDSVNLSLALAIIFLMLVTAILWFFHFLGYAHLGDALRSKGLKIMSWLVLISMLVTIVGAIVISLLVYFDVSSVMNGGADALSGIFDLIARMLAYLSIVMILACLSMILLIVFSLFLIKIKGVKFALLAGIFYLLVGLMGGLTTGTLAVLFLYPGALLMGGVSGGISSLLSVISAMYFMIAEFVFTLAALVFSSLALLDASKKF